MKLRKFGSTLQNSQWLIELAVVSATIIMNKTLGLLLIPPRKTSPQERNSTIRFSLHR